MPQAQAETSPTNLEVALFLQREKRQLPERHHDFHRRHGQNTQRTAETNS
jgi:hypothetical protein